MQDFDLFVIGGGINGAGIARDAAGRGLRVGLADQGDFGGATSSASSKLIHGGLRYLEHFEFRLVIESLAEREVLLRCAAHLVRPLQFVLPHVPQMRPAWMIRTGLWLYDNLAGRDSLARSQTVSLDGHYGAALSAALKRGFAYWDAWVDDARLVVANLHCAKRHGALLMPRTRFSRAQVEGGRWRIRLHDALGKESECTARVLINAAGPWVATVLQSVRPNPATDARVRLVKGSHIIVPRVHAESHAYILQNADRRVLFILPFEEAFSLIGTTETSVATPEAEKTISTEEMHYLLSAANAHLRQALTEKDIRWTYSGIRPLYDDDSKNASAVTRDYVLKLQKFAGAPLLNVYGGKITTYRRLAETVLAKLRPWLKSAGGNWTAREPLPGSEFGQGLESARESFYARYSKLPAVALQKIFSRHGSESAAVLRDAVTEADLGRYFGVGLYEREVRYLVEHEWAKQPEDILWRRTKAGLHMSESERENFAAWFSGTFKI